MKRILTVSIILVFISCTTTKSPVASTSTSSQTSIFLNGKIWTALFQQKAGEYNALCYQAYNIAKIRVDEALTQNSSKPYAIITDIDETVLDNSPYAVHRALKNKDYDSQSWQEWTNKGMATPLPGSLGFFNYAASKGIAIFYVTNREEAERSGTLANLKKYNYPYADSDHLLLRQGSSSKESRRQFIADKYSILLLMGDNLADFSTLWDKKMQFERNNNVDLNKEEFGKKFIIFPNPNYGGWEDAIYSNKYTLTPAQKDSAIRASLINY